MKIITLFLISVFSIILLVQAKKDNEINEDFIAEIDYRNEKYDSIWKKRGSLNFSQKSGNKNIKQNVNVVNDKNTMNEQIEEIKTECKNGNGLYYLRIKTGNNIFFSSLKSCDLIKNNFNDRFIINHLGPITSQSIISINYDVDFKYLLEAQKDKGKGFRSSVDFVENIQSIGPIFPEEKPESKIQAAQTATDQSFFSKYWWVIMIVLVIVMTRGPTGEEGAAAPQ